ncbi:trehalose utilization-domain-containing protein [Lentinula lateritia]|nr:trehalose utilization-domain-containing protein [Lentinula lateritia]
MSVLSTNYDLSPSSATNAKVLIYSATEDFRHDSIPTAIQSLQSKGPSFDIQFETTEDRAQFTDQYLAQYDTLLFFDHTGEGEFDDLRHKLMLCSLIDCRCSSTVLDDLGKAVLQKNLDLGGNFIGIHAASDCLKDTTFYGHEVGAFFDYHPALKNATVDVIDSSHPSTAQWHAQDEIIQGLALIKELLILLERGAGAESNGTAGRSFYTSLGHLNET